MNWKTERGLKITAEEGAGIKTTGKQQETKFKLGNWKDTRIELKSS